MTLSVSVLSTITLFACRRVSVRKKTSAAAKGKREHAGAPKAPIYPDIHNDGIDESKSRGVEAGIVGSEPVD